MYVHRGPYLQRGRGLGNIFGSLFRTVLPALKTLRSYSLTALKSNLVRNAGRSIASSALQGGISAVTDALDGKNVKKSLNSSLSNAKRELSRTIKESAAAGRVVKPQKRSRSIKPPPPKRFRGASTPASRRRRAPPVKSVFVDDIDDDDDGSSTGGSDTE